MDLAMYRVGWMLKSHNMGSLMAAAAQGVAMWKNAGCMVMLTSLAGTGVGPFAFSLAFANGDEFGTIKDKVSQDDAFMDWQVKYSNTATWTGNIYGRQIMD